MQKEIVIRKATFDDYAPLANFLSFEYFIHRHLDWRSALDWLGKHPFLVAERDNEILACFAAPNDVPDSTWVRLFACSASISRQEVWENFFEKALQLFNPNIEIIGVLAIENWLLHLIEKTKFQLSQEIIVFEKTINEFLDIKNRNDIQIRLMDSDDLKRVVNLDSICFPSLWQMPLETMNLAYLQSGYATVVENGEEIIAYQITTENFSSAHLARIAVLPAFQNNGIAGYLVSDLNNYYKKLGFSRITVNTQNDNKTSTLLYRKFGFTLLPDHYPVFTYPISV
jgi:ribosomal protein S18 acetylase RimI-like enzyme